MEHPSPGRSLNILTDAESKVNALETGCDIRQHKSHRAPFLFIHNNLNDVSSLKKRPWSGIGLRHELWCSRVWTPVSPKSPPRWYRPPLPYPSRDTTMLTVWVRRTPQHAFCQGVLLGCFASFPFSFCSCLLIFCFRPLSLSFLPLSPIAYLLFPLSPIFSPRGCRCVVSSVFECFHCPGGQQQLRCCNNL